MLMNKHELPQGGIAHQSIVQFQQDCHLCIEKYLCYSGLLYFLKIKNYFFFSVDASDNTTEPELEIINTKSRNISQ